MGHPDKLADQISDGVLDALLAQDPISRVACETLVTTDFCCLAGEITTKAKVDYEKVARQVIRDVGYTDDKIGFSADTCEVIVRLHSQSPRHRHGCRSRRGRRPGPDVWLRLQRHAGTDAAADRLVAPHHQPHHRSPLQEGSQLAPARQQEPGHRRIRWRPRSARSTPWSFRTQHTPEVSNEEIHDFVKNKVILPELPEELVTGDIKYLHQSRPAALKSAGRTAIAV